MKGPANDDRQSSVPVGGESAKVGKAIKSAPVSAEGGSSPLGTSAIVPAEVGDETTGNTVVSSAVTSGDTTTSNPSAATATVVVTPAPATTSQGRSENASADVVLAAAEPVVVTDATCTAAYRQAQATVQVAWEQARLMLAPYGIQLPPVVQAMPSEWQAWALAV